MGKLHYETKQALQKAKRIFRGPRLTAPSGTGIKYVRKMETGHEKTRIDRRWMAWT